MQRKAEGGENISELAESFIKPNDRLTSFERLEIYNRCYWFRVLDSLYDDFPGLLAILGNRKFLKLATAYLIQYPSESFTLRNLGSRLEQFLTEEPDWIAPHNEVALDMLRFEWAQIVAFDGPSRKPISPRELQKQTPATLRLGLQPYLSLLALDHAVDQYFIAVKNQETGGLRSEASNTSDTAPDQSHRKKRLRLPKPEKVHLAVHRHDNILYTKRLEPAAFALLSALRRGATLEEACEMAITTETPKINGKNNAKIRKAKADHDFPQRLTGWFADWSSLGWFTRP